MEEGFYREVRDGKLQCRDCKDWKPLNNFQKHTQKGKARHGSYCKLCKRARSKIDLARLRYGLSPEEFAKLLMEFPRCAICQSETSLCVDHNHKTKRVRGRLCKACNTAIGLLKENVGLLDSAKEYLTRFNGFDMLKT